MYRRCKRNLAAQMDTGKTGQTSFMKIFPLKVTNNINKKKQQIA